MINAELVASLMRTKGELSTDAIASWASFVALYLKPVYVKCETPPSNAFDLNMFDLKDTDFYQYFDEGWFKNCVNDPLIGLCGLSEYARCLSYTTTSRIGQVIDRLNQCRVELRDSKVCLEEMVCVLLAKAFGHRSDYPVLMHQCTTTLSEPSDLSGSIAELVKIIQDIPTRLLDLCNLVQNCRYQQEEQESRLMTKLAGVQKAIVDSSTSAEVDPQDILSWKPFVQKNMSFHYQTYQIDSMKLILRAFPYNDNTSAFYIRFSQPLIERCINIPLLVQACLIDDRIVPTMPIEELDQKISAGIERSFAKFGNDIDELVTLACQLLAKSFGNYNYHFGGDRI